MTGQITIFDLPQTKPNYNGIRDEIIRLHIEREFEEKNVLQRCECGKKPVTKFRSCKEYFVVCECGIKTKYYRHLYEAKQAWNSGIYWQS